MSDLLGVAKVDSCYAGAEAVAENDSLASKLANANMKVRPMQNIAPSPKPPSGACL